MSTDEQKFNKLQMDGEDHWDWIDETTAILFDETVEELKEELKEEE